MKMQLAHLATLAATIPASLSATVALAHGPHSADITLYHYLSSPDHVFTLFAVATMSLAALAWAALRSAVAVRRKKR